VNDREFKQKARRSFVVGALASLLGAATFKWIYWSEEVGGIAGPIRRMLQANGKLWQRLYNPKTTVPEEKQVDLFDEPQNHARLNGDLGLEEPPPENWKLQFELRAGADRKLLHPPLALAALKALPRIEYTTRFKCIEGWSTNVKFAGARFSDFLDAFGPADLDRKRLQYVGLETPDRGYYVSVDLASMLHPQTLLCYEMNGLPLGPDHGAPLRLVIPIKYGIKSLKRVGTLFLADARPPDYWAEQGYDWYAGL
jgi:hypothetical protein